MFLEPGGKLCQKNLSNIDESVNFKFVGKYY
jgi:hypothetical protein